eukprot:gene6864-9400_t
MKFFLLIVILVCCIPASVNCFQCSKPCIQNNVKKNHIGCNNKFSNINKIRIFGTNENIEETTLKNENSLLSIPKWIPAFAVAATGGGLFGLDIGSSSSVLRILGSGSSEFGVLDSFQLGEIASGSLFGAIISSALIVIIGDKKIGRKTELMLASLFFTLGTLTQSFSGTIDVTLFGRLLYGLGIGIAMHVAPLYIAETAPDNLRGRLISFKEAAIVGGIVVGYGAGALFGQSGNWHDVFLSALPLEIGMALLTLQVPESPRWLALRGQKNEAISSLRELQSNIGQEEANKVVDSMVLFTQDISKVTENDNKLNTNDFSKSFEEIINSKYNRRALTIGVGLVLFQQLSGQPSVLYFANRIFETSGFGFEAALGIGVFKLLMTFLSASLVENPNFGRKTLLLIGNTGVTLSLLSLALLYSPLDLGGWDVNMLTGTLISIRQIAIIFSMLIFVGSYQIGFGPITWLILSEIFPLRVRSVAVSIGTLVNFSSNLLVNFLFEIERLSVGETALFAQFAFVGLLSVLFTWSLVFETRGLSLEQIELKLRNEVDK